MTSESGERRETYETYETYQPGVAPVADDLGDDGPWRVAVEYSNRGEAKPPTIVQIGATVHTDRHQALLAARRGAFEFDPPDPWAPQGRTVFRDGPDGFLVIIPGATTTFHMRVRIVAELAAPGPAGG